MSRGTHPLVPLPSRSSPAFNLNVTWFGPVVRLMSEPKRFKVSATIQIEGELTRDELREIFLPAERLGGRVSISTGTPEAVAPVAPPSEEDIRKAQLRERVRNLTEAYREKLGEPSDQLVPALGAWLAEFGEDVIREGITEAAEAAVRGQQQRYEWLRSYLRAQRNAQRRGR